MTFDAPFDRSYRKGPDVVLRHPEEDRFGEIPNGADQVTLDITDTQCNRLGYPIRRPRNFVYNLKINVRDLQC